MIILITRDTRKSYVNARGIPPAVQQVLGEGVPTLDGGRGTYLGYPILGCGGPRGTYLGWGEEVPTLDWGGGTYLGAPPVLTWLGEGVPTLDGGYLTWMG